MTPSHSLKNILLHNIGFLLLLTFAARTLVVFGLDYMPPMERQYIFMAEELFSGSEKIFISFAPGYSALLYLLNLPIGNYQFTSYLIFIVSSTLFSYIIYKWALEKYNYNTGVIVLWVLLFLPNTAITYAGYSHCIVAALFFLALSTYRFWKLWRKETTLNHITFILPALITIALRPEMILLFVFLMSCFYLFRLTNIIKSKKSNFTWRLLLFPAILFAFVFVHKSFIKQRNINENPSAFSDSFYSYRSFVSVYCFKQGQPFTDSLSVALSTPHFGTPSKNNNSIFKAITKNPAEVVKNLLYNFIQFLKLIGHPLVLPFYFFLFVGLAFYKAHQPLNHFHIFLFSIAAIPVGTLFFFIVTVKYLSATIIPAVLLGSYGINRIESEKTRNNTLGILVISFFVISIIYYLTFLQAGARG